MSEMKFKNADRAKKKIERDILEYGIERVRVIVNERKREREGFLR